jgi:hypothetical protein
MWNFRRLLWLALAVGAAGCAPAAKADRSSWRPSAWVELTGRGAELRAIVLDGRCPDAMVDGRDLPTQPRREADRDFPQECRLALPEGASSLSVAGQVLPVPVRTVQRIVMLGDSGCRIDATKTQSCNDPKAWPFAEVARLAAAKKPDLVIHVGDYYYRETACPVGKAACAGSPYGDNFDTWQAEFFQPAAPLLAAAPWVFARGNHESCKRGGLGWFALLDAGEKPLQCKDAVSAPFAVDIGGLKLYVLDSADTDDRAAPPMAVSLFSEQLQALGPQMAEGKGWIVTHRPFWGLAPVARVGPLDPVELGINITQQQAARGKDLSGVQMIVAGHIHDFAALSFGPARPAQLVVGTGGDIGEPADKPTIRGGPRTIDGMTGEFFTFDRFGYLLLERRGEDWAGAFHDAQDRIVASCRLHERALTCQRAGAKPKTP